MTTTRGELARVLEDVRKAYRLLQAYHRRINDLLQTVEETLSKRDLVFEQWAPQNVDPLPGPKKSFFASHKWAWDLTPAYHFWCTWSTPQKGGSIQRIALEVVADTGYSIKGDGEPDPVRFANAAECSTEIWIAAWTTNAKAPNWSKAWADTQRIPQYDDGNVHAVTLDGCAYTYQYLQTVNVADLISPEAVEKHLLAPIEGWFNARSQQGAETDKQ